MPNPNPATRYLQANVNRYGAVTHDLVALAVEAPPRGESGMYDESDFASSGMALAVTEPTVWSGIKSDGAAMMTVFSS